MCGPLANAFNTRLTPCSLRWSWTRSTLRARRDHDAGPIVSAKSGNHAAPLYAVGHLPRVQFAIETRGIDRESIAHRADQSIPLAWADGRLGGDGTARIRAEFSDEVADAVRDVGERLRPDSGRDESPREGWR